MTFLTLTDDQWVKIMISKKANLDRLEESEKYRVGAFSARYLSKAIEKEFQSTNSLKKE